MCSLLATSRRGHDEHSFVLIVSRTARHRPSCVSLRPAAYFSSLDHSKFKIIPLDKIRCLSTAAHTLTDSQLATHNPHSDSGVERLERLIFVYIAISIEFSIKFPFISSPLFPRTRVHSRSSWEESFFIRRTLRIDALDIRKVVPSPMSGVDAAIVSTSAG